MDWNSKGWSNWLDSFRATQANKATQQLRGRSKPSPLAIRPRYFERPQAQVAANLLNRGEAAVAIETTNIKSAEGFCNEVRNACRNLDVKEYRINDKGLYTCYIVRAGQFKLFLAQLDDIYNG